MLLVDKPEGLTPLATMRILRGIKQELSGSKLGYAGRLDPMASGVLVIMEGAENKRRDEYLGWDKTYMVEMILGLSSDTYDVLGQVELRAPVLSDKEVSLAVEELNKMVGKMEQEYPMFSSKPVEGKPLFEWAREGVTDLAIPKKEVEIYEIEIGKTKWVGLDLLAIQAVERVKKVRGDFRQDSIIDSWKKLKSRNQVELPVIQFETKVSSGTYIRGLVNEVGRHVGSGGLCWSIRRTKAGEYALDECMKLPIDRVKSVEREVNVGLAEMATTKKSTMSRQR